MPSLDLLKFGVCRSWRKIKIIITNITRAVQMFVLGDIFGYGHSQESEA